MGQRTQLYYVAHTGAPPDELHLGGPNRQDVLETNLKVRVFLSAEKGRQIRGKSRVIFLEGRVCTIISFLGPIDA